MDLATIIFIVNVGSQLEYFKDMTQPVIIIKFFLLIRYSTYFDLQNNIT